jgi:pimeloyl-ACP methyl ester carboxylesterase
MEMLMGRVFSDGAPWSSLHTTPAEGSRFLEIEQAGHISNIEKPAILNSAVAKLFNDVEQGGALP